MNNFDSPLRYPGGKSRIFSFVSRMFFENDMIGISYAEPFAGGSGLALKLLLNEYVAKIYINDLDPAIYAFWKAVLTNAEAFCAWILKVEVNVKNWQKYKDIHTNPHSVDEFDLAKATFFLNRTNVSGVIKGGIIGGVDQKGKYKIDARFNRIDLVARIQTIYRYRRRISLSNLDGISFIKRLDRRREEVFIYLDPPYFHKAANLYMNHYARRDHQLLSNYVHKMRKRWMVSYDNNDFILNLYSEREKILHSLSRGTSNASGDEIIVFSDDLQFSKSMTYLNSAVLM